MKDNGDNLNFGDSDPDNWSHNDEPGIARPNTDQRMKAALFMADPEIKHLSSLTDEERALALEGKVDAADETTQIWALLGSLDAYDWHLLDLGSRDDADPAFVDMAQRNLAIWIARFEGELES